jgi:hypothetical protein
MKHPKISIGDTFGKLTVIEYAGRAKNRDSLWKCDCTCGITKVVMRRSLITGATTSRGCYQREQVRSKNAPEMVGKVFGKLCVIERVINTTSKSGALWLCSCACGNSVVCEETI